MRESRGSLGNERMRSAQIQVVTIAEEMGRTRTLGDCCSDTWNPGFSKTKLLATTMLLSVSMNLTTLGPSLGYHITLLSCLLWLLLTVAVSQNFFVLMTLTVLRSTAQESF
ncbi:uncharacterized protein LOC113931550 isoform X7 [Zalophus californianus]|uniref:Uncharacterized protein LOC113931550 isoform X7 n=1 Tax=Zalophus californianus TaxID=9704 RepID=A0A6J2EF15_ZALCA|nr:uncharacterized protein LOC113931550 isoform X7 [Zalophus californianus]